MIEFMIAICFAFRFVYICRVLRRLHDSPEAASKVYFPVFSFGAWGLYLYCAAYRGLVVNPHSRISDTDDISMWLMVALAAATILSFFALFRCGEWAATVKKK